MSWRTFSGTVSRTVMAMEYGSSPVEQPADQIRSRCPGPRFNIGTSTCSRRYSK